MANRYSGAMIAALWSAAGGPLTIHRHGWAATGPGATAGHATGTVMALVRRGLLTPSGERAKRRLTITPAGRRAIRAMEVAD